MLDVPEIVHLPSTAYAIDVPNEALSAPPDPSLHQEHVQAPPPDLIAPPDERSADVLRSQGSSASEEESNSYGLSHERLMHAENSWAGLAEGDSRQLAPPSNSMVPLSVPEDQAPPSDPGDAQTVDQRPPLVMEDVGRIDVIGVAPQAVGETIRCADDSGGGLVLSNVGARASKAAASFSQAQKEFLVGAVRGVEDALTPLGIGGLLPTPMDDSAPFQVGRGLAQALVGATEIQAGARGEALGLAMDATGAGALEGVPVGALATAVAAQGVGTMAVGLRNVAAGVMHVASEAGPSLTGSSSTTGEGPVSPESSQRGRASEGNTADGPDTERATEAPTSHEGDSVGASESTVQDGSRLAPELEIPEPDAPTGIVYSPVDACNRPTSVEATLRWSEVTPGPKGPNPDPAAGTEKQIGYEISHLFGRQFGGGQGPENITTASGASNRPLGPKDIRPNSMWETEMKVRRALIDGQTVRYRVTAIYDGSAPYPSAFHMQAKGSGPGGISIDTVVRNWTHHP